MIIFSRKNPWFLGKPTILGNPDNMDMFMKNHPKKIRLKLALMVEELTSGSDSCSLRDHALGRIM